MLQRWNNLAVAKKLYAVVGLMALLIAVELFTLGFAMRTLLAVRAFVNGEALWSKAQRDSISALEKYTITADQAYFDAFQKNLQIPLGDHQARLQLGSPEMDIELARAGLRAGGNHPDDILPMIRLVRNFYWVPQLARAIEQWTKGDDLLMEFQQFGNGVRAGIAAHPGDRAEIEKDLAQLSELNARFTVVENGFSAALGDASRWLEHILLISLLGAVLTVETTGLTLTVRFTRALGRSLGELNRAAKRVAAGDFSQKVEIKSGDELGQLARSINQMVASLESQLAERAQAEKASWAKNLFLANMSHEIRTPLNSILGFSKLLRNPAVTEADKEKYSAIIQRTGASLVRIINDILDISRIEAERLEISLQDFSLTQLLSDVELLSKVRSDEKGLRLTFEKKGEVPEFMRSDPARLRQILLNLIGNAVKFTDAGSVAVAYFLNSEKDIVFEVRDTGLGITPEQVRQLFKPFSPGDATETKRHSGTGLGLAISRRLAGLLGGDLYLVESQLGKGTAFGVRIRYQAPLSLNPAQISEKATVAASAGPGLGDPSHFLRGKRFLVAEDMEDNRVLAGSYLELYGIEVDFAEDGEEVIKKIERQPGFHDVILMDMQMPKMDGFSATVELRKKGIQVPIIALTGYAMKTDRERCLSAGCDEMLAKPIDWEKLVSVVLKILPAQAT